MRTLVLDCSSEACSVALFDGSELVEWCLEVLGRGYAERIVPMIRDLPNRGRAARVVAGLGPGSFTGIRIAIATALFRLPGKASIAVIPRLLLSRRWRGPRLAKCRLLWR